MKLSNKRILIISSENWDHIKISKHHYALELSENNSVYFLNPPTKDLKYLSFTEKKINSNLVVLENSLFFPYVTKFHFPALFDFLLKLHIKRINKNIGTIDIVWGFTSFYKNLKKFNTKTTIYHVADMLKDKGFIKTANSADFLFCVTKEIKEKFKHKNNFLIEHGLSSLFFKPAYQKIQSYENKSIQVAYCGNLLVESIDRSLIVQLVKINPKITFHFIGPYKSTTNTAEEFINELESAKNVKLYGKVTPQEISEIYINIDAFILCYNRKSTFSQNRNASSNSHKMLEYISTGKVVISTNMSAYRDKKDLIEMLNGDNNIGYIELFEKVVNNLTEYNSKSRQEKRFKFAEQNSYKNRIKEIEKIITNIEY